MTSAIVRRSHAPCSNPYLIGGWRSVFLTISISSGPSIHLAPGGFLSDMLSSPRSCTLQSHSRTVEYGRISRSRILRMLALIFLSQHAARMFLAFPDGRAAIISGMACVSVSGRRSLPVGRVPGLLHPRPSEALMCICHVRIDQNLSVWAGVMPLVIKVSGS